MTEVDLQLAAIRHEYARYVDSGDMHEFVRAVGQALDQRDDLLDPPIVVPRPVTIDNIEPMHLTDEETDTYWKATHDG